MQLNARLKTRFRCGSLPSLTSQHTVTRWLILQKARRHTTKVLRLLVGTRFQVLFHSPLGVLFTFPSRYWFTIGHRRVFSLREWSPWIHTGFHVSGITRDTAMLHFASHTGLSPSMVTFSKVFCSRFAYNVAVLQPQPRLATPLVWAVPRSLATTGGIINLFSLPAGTKMFQFPALALTLKC